MIDASVRARPVLAVGCTRWGFVSFEAGHFGRSGHDAAQSPFGERCDYLALLDSLERTNTHKEVSPKRIEID